MINISSYVDYLPSFLWTQENDPSQFLGRMLRIFEKMLTGITVDAQAVRASATIRSVNNNIIQLTDNTNAAKFRAGDSIKIEGTEGTTEQVKIVNIQGALISLDKDLGSFTNGNMRINDLTPGQTTFRVDNTTGLEPGSIIKITQGTKSEERTIQKLTDNFITLSAGLVNTYSMALTDVPVRIQDKITIDAQAIKARATIKNAVNNTIQLTDNTNAAKFRAGDVISIEGTTERVRIDHIDHIEGAEIFLNENLTDTYNSRNMLINDLIPGQTTFRVDNMTGLEPGSVIKITQGAKREEKTIQKLTDNFITLSSGLVNTYSMALTDFPVRIQDVTSIIHRANKHGDFEKTIDELHRIFNPWHTDFLPWLASWVALTLQKDWSEYQKRKLISEIVSIYQEHGLKKGLHTYLDNYAATEARPRIAIDDGDAIFRATFLDNGTAVLHTVAYSSEVLGQPVLLHPSAIAADNNNNYIIAEGDTNPSPPQQPALWKVSSTGEIEYKTLPNKPLPMPNPIYVRPPAGDVPKIDKPTAVVVDKQNRCSVIDAGKSASPSPTSAIYRFDPDIKPVIKKPAVHPVDMILDGSENFVVLDRGVHPTGENPGSPEKDSGQKIVVVSEEPLAVAEHRLREVVEPTALVMDSMGRFIVADAKDQATSDPANLVRVDPTAGWSETSLLEDENNPLIFPTGLAFEDPETLLVCDTGFRLGFEGDDENNRTMAEPAAIYRIDLSQTPPTITRVTYERKLVNPTKMMIDRKGKLIITDKGESKKKPPREWRTKANEFGISLFFSNQRLTSNDDRNRIRRGIENVVNERKPGHTSWWLRS